MTKLIKLNDAKNTLINPDNIVTIKKGFITEYNGEWLRGLEINGNIDLIYPAEDPKQADEHIDADMGLIIKHLERIKSK